MLPCSPPHPTPHTLSLILLLPAQRRNYLSALAKQKRFQFTESDDRVCSPVVPLLVVVAAPPLAPPPQIVRYLYSAQEDYRTVFQRMREYYRPEHLSHKPEERLLHHAPNGKSLSSPGRPPSCLISHSSLALRRLTHKAQLLGYTPSEVRV